MRAAKAIPPQKLFRFVPTQPFAVYAKANGGPVNVNLDPALLNPDALEATQQPHGLLPRVHVAMAHFADSRAVLPLRPNRVSFGAVLDKWREALLESQQHACNFTRPFL